MEYHKSHGEIQLLFPKNVVISVMNPEDAAVQVTLGSAVVDSPMLGGCIAGSGDGISGVSRESSVVGPRLVEPSKVGSDDGCPETVVSEVVILVIRAKLGGTEFVKADGGNVEAEL